MFFDNWNDILKIVISGPVVYAGLILMLRISGKRTLTQMNAFDFIVTVAFGSVIATAILSKDVSVVEGLTGLAILVLLQFLVSFTYVRVKPFNKAVKSVPRLLYYRGNFKTEVMQAERIEKEELLQAARQQGLLSLNQVVAIVLETNGKISIIKTAENQPDESALESVNRQ